MGRGTVEEGKRGPEEEEGGEENEKEGTVKSWEGRCWDLNKRYAHFFPEKKWLGSMCAYLRRSEISLHLLKLPVLGSSNLVSSLAGTTSA